MGEGLTVPIPRCFRYVPDDEPLDVGDDEAYFSKCPKNEAVDPPEIMALKPRLGGVGVRSDPVERAPSGH